MKKASTIAVLSSISAFEAPPLNLDRWQSHRQHRVRKPEGEITIAVVGKYINRCSTAYKSLAEALTHGGIANNVRVKLQWLDSEIFERPDYPYGVIHHLRAHTHPGARRLRQSRHRGDDPRG